ncbi:MAG: transglutaminase-like cysteine peptidase [Campylobacterota bacterium]|nr:transglutaminase-like cysteine peptidase [Campylobacterota bacterium]
MVFFTTVLLGNSYPYFTNKDFIYIQKNSGTIAKNRVQDYQKTITSYETISKDMQLSKVNLYLNQLLPQHDTVIQNKEDYWASPKEFLATGFGDCEDYVIIKYFTLIKLGFNKERLFFTTAKEKYIGGYHMVLSYFKDDAKPPLILDNLSFRILSLEKRKDLEADLFINTNGIFKIGTNHKLTKVKKSSPKFEKLIKKIQKEN